jgi:hypothetical protein
VLQYQTNGCRAAHGMGVGETRRGLFGCFQASPWSSVALDFATLLYFVLPYYCSASSIKTTDVIAVFLFLHRCRRVHLLVKFITIAPPLVTPPCQQFRLELAHLLSLIPSCLVHRSVRCNLFFLESGRAPPQATPPWATSLR